jgi:hypothetical protein
MREKPLVTISHEEHLELQVYCMDHEPFILAQGLAIDKVVRHTPCGPTKKEVYAHLIGGLSIG